MTDDERRMERQVEAGATEEQYLLFLVGLQDLVRSEHLGPVDRLSAVRQAITHAVGGDVTAATDWAERVTLGLLHP